MNLIMLCILDESELKPLNDKFVASPNLSLHLPHDWLRTRVHKSIERVCFSLKGGLFHFPLHFRGAT